MSNSKKAVLHACLIAACMIGAHVGASAAGPNDGKLALAALPFALQAQLDLGTASVSNQTLVLQAGKGTDLYANTDGSDIADRTPRVLFQPAGDFILSAKVTAAFNKPFDGAALIVYGDRANWAKLLFEFGKTNEAGISTTVARGVGDDAHHGARSGRDIYLKVLRRQNMFVFYTSPDGRHWSMVRNFSLPEAGSVKVGFSAQSPAGDGCTAQFSEIQFKQATFKDFWQGE